jgi:hypothetical protein
MLFQTALAMARDLEIFVAPPWIAADPDCEIITPKKRGEIRGSRPDARRFARCIGT